MFIFKKDAISRSMKQDRQVHGYAIARYKNCAERGVGFN